MKDLIIILSFVAMFAGACMSARNQWEYKDVPVRFIRIEDEKRWVDNKEVSKQWFVYVDDNRQEHWLESYHRERYILQVRR